MPAVLIIIRPSIYSTAIKAEVTQRMSTVQKCRMALGFVQGFCGEVLNATILIHHMKSASESAYSIKELFHYVCNDGNHLDELKAAYDDRLIEYEEYRKRKKKLLHLEALCHKIVPGMANAICHRRYLIFISRCDHIANCKYSR